MKKLIFIFLSVLILFSCTPQYKLMKSTKKAKRMTMRDFRKGKITVEYPNLTP